MINGNSVVLEYSIQQKAFHRTTVNGMLQHNLTLVAKSTSVDYLPIGIFETHEACDGFYKQVEPLIRELEERPELSHLTIEELIQSVNQ